MGALPSVRDCAEARRFHRVSRRGLCLRSLRRAHLSGRRHALPPLGLAPCRTGFRPRRSSSSRRQGDSPARLARGSASASDGWRIGSALRAALRSDSDAGSGSRPALAPGVARGAGATKLSSTPELQDRIRAAACRVLAETRPELDPRGRHRPRGRRCPSAAIHYYFKSKDEVLLSALCWTASCHGPAAAHGAGRRSDPGCAACST